MSKEHEVAHAKAWDRLTNEQRLEVAADSSDGVSEETFRRLIVGEGPPIVALIGFTEGSDGTSRYVSGDFVDYVQHRLADEPA